LKKGRKDPQYFIKFALMRGFSAWQLSSPTGGRGDKDVTKKEVCHDLEAEPDVQEEVGQDRWTSPS